ncbi:MAG TPA: AarF/UbiB family protein [Thermomicrobiales bacterium]|nr:AarF/UbiB family protein [Thermomicrobiales bacterium]
MAQLQRRVSVRSAAGGLVAGRISRHPERYVEIYRIARKHRLHHVLAQVGLGHRHEDDEAALDGHAHDDGDDGHAADLADALEELGPCFIKLGQLLSTRPDFLPPDYIQALARLQDTVTPVPGDRVARLVERELGAPLGELFRSFDHRPLATASMAQAHRAVLPDGSEVVVKAQRPGVRRRIEIDLEVLHELARFAARRTAFGARYGLVQMVRELEHSLGQELDFRQEADNTRLIGRQIADFPRLVTPTVYGDYTAGRVLTLSFVRGRHLADVGRAELQALDARAIANDLLTAYLKQIVVDGVFHCDPHPGNILLTDDGRLALLDFGMVGRLDAGQKDNIILLLLAFAERLGERVADTYLELIEIPEGFDRRAFTQDVCALVSRYHDMSGGRMALGTALLDLTRVAQAHRTPVPTALTLLGKTMLNLDGAIRVLSPELDPVQLIRDYMLEVMQQRVLAQLSPGRVFAWVLDMKHLFEHSPRLTERALDKLANDQLALRLDVNRLDTALARSADRLSRGMIASALIIGGGGVLRALLEGKRRPSPPRPPSPNAGRGG